MPLPNNVIPLITTHQAHRARQHQDATADLAHAVFTVKQVADLLSLSLTEARELIDDGTIPSYRQGRRPVVPQAWFWAWLDSVTVHADPNFSATQGRGLRPVGGADA
jgi:excisionase family DNA binding protein